MHRFQLFRPRGGVAARLGLQPIAEAGATNMLAYVEGDIIIDVVEHRALLVRRLADESLDGHELVPTHYAAATLAGMKRQLDHPDLPKDGRPWVYIGNSPVVMPRPGHPRMPRPGHPLWTEYREMVHGTQAFDIYGQPLNSAEYAPLFGIPNNAPAGFKVKS